MPEQNKQLNAKEVKEKIRNFLEMIGPALPVQVARHMQMNSIFASAFLSEMAHDGTVKISNMKVGGSPLYYTPQKLPMLENFIKNLGGKEKEACNLLKEKGILEDASLHPAIRVALRSTKDFAFPFKQDNKIFWRYFLITEENVRTKMEPEIQSNKEEVQKLEESTEEIQKEEIKQEKEENKEVDERIEELRKLKQELLEKQQELDQAKKQIKIAEKENKREENKDKIAKIIKDKTKKPKPKTPEESFLIEIKQTLSKKKIELINIEKADKKEVFARIKMHDGEYLLAAFNKKKVEDGDLLKAYKKSLVIGLPYYILSKGEPSKKTKEAIEAHKKLASMDKIEISENESNSDQTPEQ